MFNGHTECRCESPYLNLSINLSRSYMPILHGSQKGVSKSSDLFFMPVQHAVRQIRVEVAWLLATANCLVLQTQQRHKSGRVGAELSLSLLMT